MSAKLIKYTHGNQIVLGIQGNENEILEFEDLGVNWGLIRDHVTWSGPGFAYFNTREDKLIRFFENIEENRIALKLGKTEFGPRFAAYCHKKAMEDLANIPEERFCY
jgi:hypothetical protein